MARDLAAALARSRDRGSRRRPPSHVGQRLRILESDATGRQRSVLPWALGCFGVSGSSSCGGSVFVYFDSWDKEPRSPDRRAQASPAAPAATPQPAPEETAPPPEESIGPPPAEPEAAISPSIEPMERIAVEITSEPGRCRVSIDGRHAGFTPLTETLKPGRHQFTCDWPGQGSRSVEETISSERRRLRFQL